MIAQLALQLPEKSDTTRTSMRSPCANKQHHDIAADEAAEFDTTIKEKESWKIGTKCARCTTV